MTKKLSTIEFPKVRASASGSKFIWTATLIGIAILLLALALLQYRWNAQIRQAAELRAGADLESVMMKWHLDLYGELSTICVALQLGPDSGAHDRWYDYLERYEKWRQAGSVIENIYSNPDIVSDIYIWETTRGAKARLLRLNAIAGRIEPVKSPTDLNELLTHLQKRSRSLAVALRAWAPDEVDRAQSRNASQSSTTSRLRSNSITGWQFDESIPAIVHPIVNNSRSGSDSSIVDWFVIVLNRSTIEQRVFPELTERYFAAGQTFEYKIAVVSVGTASRLLYSSDPDFGINDVSNSDSVMNIFGPPPESTEGSFWQGVKNKVSLRGEEWHSFSGPVWFPILQHTSQGGSWMLFLQHRSIPLEAQIKRVWRGNLILGGAILLLLTVSMFLVITASQRVRVLAAMQMNFVASISHELRTPLAAMLSAGQNIADGYAPDPQRYGSIITNESRHLIDLVDQILLFAAMKDGKKQYVMEPLEIEGILKRLQKTTLPILEQQGFAVQVEIPEEIPPVLGDRQGVLRCMQNLLDNAAKYGGNNRWIGIRVEATELANWGREVAISIVDRGIGVDPDDLEHICDPFYRSARVVAAQIPGSGLGLAVVHHILKAIDGRLSVTSEQGQGSVFTVHLRTTGKAQSNSHHNTAEAMASI
ncbi:MAG TPA: HAMP domain-containing sensor histidine kinase [Candidatus Binatia bacterium]|nr:HAMP domain-containing sensor histidine kinase [Candidatus Binatia bacterium]